ncbi:MAG: hypothetical protein JWL98_145 [Xanthomonadaceae bacterium]|nr:hypothetical protein [Xanthomonadaceae bacterium]
MSTPVKILSLAVTLAIAGCNRSPPPAAESTAPPVSAVTETAPTVEAAAPSATAIPAPQLQAAMRALWHGHIVATRDYAVAVHAHKDADQKHAADAVVANARQISDAVAGFYGKAGGDRMLELLSGHWSGVQALTDARGRRDDVGADKAMNDLTTNAGDIAKFLAGANPNLPEDTVRGLMLAHVAHHGQQIQQIMAGDIQGEATTWTAMQQHMDTVADALAGAIAKQFPGGAKAG